ncbi:MAG: 4-hydroxybenzoate octaprenyltransferase, partial [Bacteroidetes bacterium]|nr:4-hydroxybenzoate octaprenyltransferase [Bacteroidota bacterium]
LGLLYYTGLAVVAMVLFYEQSLVRADDFSRVNMAFFNMNGVVSLLFFAATTGDVLILGSPLT